MSEAVRDEAACPGPANLLCAKGVMEQVLPPEDPALRVQSGTEAGLQGTSPGQ